MSERLRRPLMPWQRQVVDTAFELDDDGSYHYDEVVLTVPRQSGKTALVMAIAVHRLVVVPRSLGRQRLTYTAQLRAKAKLKLERDFSEVLRDAKPAFREITHIRNKPQAPTEWKLSLNNGSENIQFGRGNYWQIDAPSRTGGHGDTLDVGVIDEAFAHPDDTIEAGMSPSMITRENRQLVVLSTAGDAKSKYLWRKTLAGRGACEAGRHGRTAYFEWSAEDDADPGDPDTWRSCSPALGYTITLRALEGEWEKARRDGQEGIDKFRRAYLNQWPEIPLLGDEIQYRIIPVEAWAGCLKPRSLPRGRVFYALDVAPDGRSAAVVGSDGVHVEVAKYGKGTAWVVDECVARRELISELVLDPSGPAGTLMPWLTAAGVPVREITTAEGVQACGAFLAAVAEEAIAHLGQPELDLAVANADRREVGDGGWMWSRKRSAVDISPLYAATFARWAATQGAGVSVYEDRGLAKL